jgi:carboxylate-amine ligase
MDRVREVFDASEDFTVGIEEEFAIVDPHTRSLAQRFEELHAVATGSTAA